MYMFIGNPDVLKSNGTHVVGYVFGPLAAEYLQWDASVPPQNVYFIMT